MDETKRRLEKSPDGMDSVNLAYARPSGWESPSSAPAPEVQRKGFHMGGEAMARSQPGQGWFGRS